MSEAEDKFREVVTRAILDVWDVHESWDYDPSAAVYVDAIVGNLKLDSWLVTGEKIHEVLWAESSDFDDDFSRWFVYTRGVDKYLSVIPSEEDEEFLAF